MGIIYKNCSEIPISNFFKLLETGDLALLFKEPKDFEKSQEEKLFKIFSDIVMEYHELTSNDKFVQQRKAEFDIEYLEFRYNMTKQLLSIYNETEELEVLILLKELNWKINLEADPVGQLKHIVKNLIGLKNRIKIKKSAYRRKYKTEAQKSTPNFKLEDQLIELEVGIPLSFRIDPDTDTISRYIKWMSILEQKNKAVANG